MKSLRVALVHNLKPLVKEAGRPADYYSECDSPKTVGYITQAIELAGHKVFPVEADSKLPLWLAENPVDLVFNISEGFSGEAREARVPALLELLEIPYTGSGVLALALSMDKARSKYIFRSVGIPTPNFQVFTHLDEPLDSRLQFPLIVKPNREGSGKGILTSSVVRSEAALRAQIQRVFTDYGQEVLVEEFIEGVELTVGLLGEEVLPILEIDFSPCAPAGESFYSWKVKEYQGNKEMHLDPKFWCPARLSLSTAEAVGTVAKKAAFSLGCRDFSRVDIRLSQEGIPYVLEVNTLPGLDPEESNIPMMTKAAGIPYATLISRIIQLAVVRLNKPSDKSLPASSPSPELGAVLSIPSFKTNNPVSQAPAYRVLPDPMEKEAGPSSNPAAVSDGKKLGKTI